MLDSAPPAPAPVPASAYLRGFDDLPREHGFEDLEVVGRIPADLKGTLYSTGPAVRGLFGESYEHWFDGDGAVSAVRFDGGRAQGGVRLVATPGLQRERALGRMIYAGYHRRPSSLGLRLKMPFKRGKNVANTAMMVQGGKLYALWEGGTPIEVDPDTLETLGPDDFGVIEMAYSAHPHRVPARGATYNFGLSANGRPMLDVYETRDGTTRKLTSFSLFPVRMVHDFIATDRHLVFFIPPVRIPMLKSLLGIGGFSENLSWEPELGTEIVVVPIDAPEKIVRFRGPPFYQWHFLNAHERGDDIVVDLCRYPDFRTNEWLHKLYQGRPLPEAYATLDRATITTKSERFAIETIWDHSCEFPMLAPSVRGAEHRYAYFGAHRNLDAVREGLLDRTVKVDVETGNATMLDFGPGTYPGEPYFVARPDGNEDDGWLLQHVYDAGEQRTCLAIIDARAMDLLACAWFPDHVPFRLHADWLPS